MAESVEPLRLKPGTFYASRNGYVWCCFRVALGEPEQARAACIRVSDGRVETFYPDGRYDYSGKREHTLIREMEPECAIISDRPPPPGG